MAVQLLEGRSCLLCLVAALNALALLGISLAWDARNWIRLLVVLPLGLVALLLIPSPKQEPPFIHHEIVSKPGSSGWSAPVQIVVFENARCPYCDELRQRLVPAITREFGPRVSWFFRNASELPEIRNTPTVVVVPSDRTKSGSVIEGLPTVDVLSSVIRKALPASGGEVR
jgi:hypothetical protein